MASEKSKLIVLEPCTKSVEDLLALVLEKGQAEIVRTQTAEEATQLVVQLQPCMLVACIQENGEVPSRVNLMKRLEPVIKKGMLKSFITSKLKNRQLSTLITSFGVTDFIEEPAPVRTMQFKANLQLKAVETIRKQQEMKKQSQEQIVFKKSEAKKVEEAAVGQDASAKLKPALQLEQDSFLFKNSGAKKVGKKFVVEMEGPDPATGDWVPHEDKGDAKTSWRWMPKDENGKPQPSDGATEGWVHEGEKPEFKDASGKWQFASEKPDLSFREKGEKVATKLSLDEKGELQVAEDSPAAEENVKKNRALARARREKAAPQTNDKTGTNPQENADEAVTLGQSGAGPRTDAAALARKLGAGVGESQAEAEAAFNNQTGGAKDGPAGAFNELKNSEPEAPTEFNGLASAEPEEKKPLSPLEFLQKKKKQKAVDAAARLGEGLPEETSAATVETTVAETESSEQETAKDESTEPLAAKAAKPKKSAATAAQEALARMKAKMGKASELPEDSVAAEDSPTQSETNPTVAEEIEAAAPDAVPAGEEKNRVAAARTEGNQEDSPAGREKSAKLEKIKKEKKRAILAEVQGILDEPLPAQLPPAEEERLRRKHQPEGAAPLPPRELARKERLSRVKELKDRLSNLDDELRATTDEEAPTNVHDLNHEEENTSSMKSFQKEERTSSRRAFDGEADAAGDEADGKIEQSRETKNGKKRREAEERFVYLPEADLTPAGGAWEKAGDEHYAFLPAEVRYRGFDRLEDLLPFWVFRGERVPELLDKTKQWRFLARLPTQVRTPAEIPGEVRDFLLALRDQLKQEKSAREEDTEKSETGGDQAESLKEIFAEKQKKKRGAGDDLAAKLDRLKAGLAGEGGALSAEDSEPGDRADASTDGEEPLESKKKDKNSLTAEAESESESTRGKNARDESATEDDAIGATKKNDGADSAVEESPPEAKKRRDDGNGAEAADERSGKKTKNSPGQALQDKLASLKAQLGSGETSAEAPAEESAARAETPPAADSSLEKVSKSAAFQAFQERRKKKVREDAVVSAAAAPSSREPYLGIYVALSNAIGQSGEFEKSLQRVLAAVEGSFGACSAALLHPADAATPDMARVRVTTGTLTTNDTVSLGDGTPFPVVQEDGAIGEILGYLFLKASGERSAFEPGEAAAARKAALALWPVLVTEARHSSDRKEAA